MRRNLQWQAAAALALVTVMSAASAGAAAPSNEDRAGNVSSVARTGDGRAVSSEAVARDVIAYWTPERMAAAVDLDVVKVKNAVPPSRQERSRDRRPSGLPSKVEPSAPTVAGGGGPGSLAAVPTAPIGVGKAYFTLPDGSPAQCSASTVNSDKKRLVVTAAHCVYSGRWHTNFQFVPGDNNGFRPYGTWVASELNARTAWISSRDYREDFAFGIMKTNNAGQKIADVAGSQGWWTNIGYYNNVIAFGYPGSQNNGESVFYCQSPTQQYDDQRVWLGCTILTTGASGGPWLWSYDSTTRLGYINGVISQSNEIGVLTSSYFDNDFRDLYWYAEGRSMF